MGKEIMSKKKKTKKMKKKTAKRKTKKKEKPPTPVFIKADGIYISENGDWGDSDSITFVYPKNLMTTLDYEVLGEMSQFELLEYASDHAGRTPTEYVKESTK